MLTEHQLSEARKILGNNYVIVPLENWNAEVQHTKQLEKALEEIATNPIALKVAVLQEIARQALGKEETP